MLPCGPVKYYINCCCVTSEEICHIVGEHINIVAKGSDALCEVSQELVSFQWVSYPQDTQLPIGHKLSAMAALQQML